LAAAGVLFFALRSARRAPPNILLITLDTTRADHLGAYGYKLARTPRLDRLARDGVLFERAIAAAPITLPAHVSLLTGTYPFAHGVRNNGNFSLSDAIPTLATALHDRGYRTAAFVSAFVLDRRYGLARGFDVYDDRMQLERQGDRTASAAIGWLKTLRPARPFFLWLHLYDPHDPYTPPARFNDAFADRPYDGEIAFDDEVIASVLRELDQIAPDSTIVAVVGDHGESLGEHGEATHGIFVYESTLHVPMILSWPGHVPAARRVAAPVRGIDLAPTLLDLAGAPPLSGAQGTSLVTLVDGHAAKTSVVYSESYFPLLYMNWAPLRSIQDEKWKFIDAPSPELYDLAADAAEQTNLIERMPGRAAELRRALDELTGGGTGAMAERKLDREAAAKLAALGYVSATASTVVPQGSAGSDKPDPKQMIGVFNAIREANAALQQGRFDRAADLARDALARDPKNAFAILVLANANRERGRYREAAAGYRAYLEFVPTSADAHHRMAICYARLGDADRALAESEAALAIDPRFGDAHDLRGGLLAERGRVDEAIRALRTAVEIDPDNTPYRVGLARVLVAARKLEDADAELRRALQLQPANPDVHAGLAGLLVARGRADAAIDEFERSLKIRPDADDVRLDLARTLEGLGRAADARRQYEQLASAPETPPDIRAAARDRLRRRP
jgi:choline-sulfatase